MTSLLLGAQAGLDAGGVADLLGDLFWGSTPITEGPHAELLRLGKTAPAQLSDQAILDSRYGRMARAVIDGRGRFFDAIDDAGIVSLARDFIARQDSGSGAWQAGTVRPRSASTSSDPVLVAPISGSSLFQVLDGHHRVAAAAARGATHVRVSRKRFPVTTPLQRHLNAMSWIGGTQELYQPLSAPELAESWVTVRRCTDRMQKIQKFLVDRDLVPPVTATSLDVASCYGWFVSEFSSLGFDARGVERDPLAVPLGTAAYALDPRQITTGDAVDYLADCAPHDVVTCFSLLHHFVLGRGSVTPERLVELLYRSTGRVLFVDTGQGDEKWFTTSLKGWTPARIADFLGSNSGFAEVVDLGPDEDRVPPYASNYGRHLFACVR